MFYRSNRFAINHDITGISSKASGPEIRPFCETNQTCILPMVSGPFAVTIINENGDELTTCLQVTSPEQRFSNHCLNETWRHQALKAELQPNPTCICRHKDWPRKRPYSKFYDPKESALREKIWCPLHDYLNQEDAGSVEYLAWANLVSIADQVAHLQQ
ncbi:unnamed protein product [Fusarium venenatum]|uniref:Uncharacterized protein n=1 Tax=Fusarium venenatum TaxID=56646 RepID=A0A2L2TEZ7_9HYPO|nr:uncharacterized protein FVRRES_08616 [Fusarium venenatum]CEI68539.1 unnamed protein product [Fusarium venenatum]